VDANMQPGMLRGPGEKEELDKTAKKNNIKISLITETKKKLRGTKEAENCMVIYSGVNGYTRGQSGLRNDMGP
jgi:hypothetical protein